MNTDTTATMADLNGDGADELAVFAAPPAGGGVLPGVHMGTGNGRFDAPELAWSSDSPAWHAALLTASSGALNGTGDDPRATPVLPAPGFGDLGVAREPADGSRVFEVLLATGGHFGPETKIVSPE
ncbi:hypothetical protein AB0I28_25895 [Phytomonospora sp. NPDC050363]|uniref:hypothetical protein n=1 Tax=Phytomonospora sp. NPDC050363 TaxID=3155642 RepID=UPI0033DB1AEE